MTDLLDETMENQAATSTALDQAPQEVSVVLRSPQPDTEADSSGTPSSTFWGFTDFTVNHGFARTLVFPATVTVNGLSQVAVSITELTGNGTPFLGAAIMNVDNVVPSPGRVTVRGDVHWDSPLRVRLNFIIVN